MYVTQKIPALIRIKTRLNGSFVYKYEYYLLSVKTLLVILLLFMIILNIILLSKNWT